MGKLKTLLNNGAVYIIIGTFVSKFVTLFGSIFVVRLMTKGDYGLLSYMENLYSFVFLIAGMGLSNAAIRYIVLGENISTKKGYYDYIKKEGLLYNIILVCIAVIINLIYPHPLEFESSKYLLAIMFVMIPFQYGVNSNLAAERAMFNNKKYAIMSCISGMLVIMGKVCGIFAGGIYGVVLATVFVNVLLCLYTNKSINYKYFKNVPSVIPTKKIKKEIRVYSIQYMITNGLWILFTLSDVFLLGVLGTTSVEIADYKIATVWPSNIGIIGSCIAIYVSPYFVKQEKNLKWIRKNFIKVYLINFIITILIAAFVFLFSKPLVLIYAGEKYLNTVPLMRILLFGAIINNGVRMITANTLAAMGQVRYNMVISLAGFIIKILMNLILIPRIGVYAVAYTNIIVYLFMAVALLLIFIRKYYLYRSVK